MPLDGTVANSETSMVPVLTPVSTGTLFVVVQPFARSSSVA